jgi:hypothetical protein
MLVNNVKILGVVKDRQYFLPILPEHPSQNLFSNDLCSLFLSSTICTLRAWIRLVFNSNLCTFICATIVVSYILFMAGQGAVNRITIMTRPAFRGSR